MDIIQVFSVIGSISVIIASFVAIYGISSWRREAKWKTKYELAENTLSLFYEIREIIQAIRSPFGFVGEGKTRAKKEGESTKESELLDRAYVVFERYENNKEPFLKLRTVQYRYMTVFGLESEQYFREIYRIIDEIMNAARRLGNIYWKKQFNDLSSKNKSDYSKELKRLENIFWTTFEENEPIKLRVDKIISKIEGNYKSLV